MIRIDTPPRAVPSTKVCPHPLKVYVLQKFFLIFRWPKNIRRKGFPTQIPKINSITKNDFLGSSVGFIGRRGEKKNGGKIGKKKHPPIFLKRQKWAGSKKKKGG